MKKIYTPLIVALFAAIALIIGIIIGHSDSNAVSTTLSSNPKINAILSLIDQNYVDSINTDELTDAVIPEILHYLDPHSVYIPAKDVESANEDLEGSFSGIGVQFNMQEDTIMVVDVISGGPSERVGIRPGDRIIEVEGENFTGDSITTDKVLKTLRGDKGTKVNIKVKRAGAEEPVPFTITRDDIPVNSIDIAYMITPTVGYLKVSQFGANTYDEFVESMMTLVESGAREVIIDLRYNGGGYLSAVVDMLNEFLEKDELLMYTEGLHYPRQEIRANGRGDFRGMNVCVLINEYSASASEIFAGAIQDLDKGIIVGRRSFGKGLVQEQIPLSDGSEIRLTTARYYIPSGRCIQKPYKQGEIDKYDEDIEQRYTHGEFYSADSITLDKEHPYHTKKGRVVYGGGGIMPDYFVAEDSLANNNLYKALVTSSCLYDFSFKYADRNRKSLSTIKSWQAMQKHIKGSNYMNEFKQYLAKKGITYTDAEYAECSTLVENLIQAYIIRNILGDSGFYPVFNQSDITIKRALEVMSK